MDGSPDWIDADSVGLFVESDGHRVDIDGHGVDIHSSEVLSPWLCVNMSNRFLWSVLSNALQHGEGCVDIWLLSKRVHW